jgi:hypothetical protein
MDPVVGLSSRKQNPDEAIVKRPSRVRRIPRNPSAITHVQIVKVFSLEKIACYVGTEEQIAHTISIVNGMQARVPVALNQLIADRFVQIVRLAKKWIVSDAYKTILFRLDILVKSGRLPPLPVNELGTLESRVREVEIMWEAPDWKGPRNFVLDLLDTRDLFYRLCHKYGVIPVWNMSSEAECDACGKTGHDAWHSQCAHYNRPPPSLPVRKAYPCDAMVTH